MTPLANFTAALHLTLSLMLLWILVFKLFRDYRVDALRDRLFVLREKLFDYAASGNISFDHPAYTKSRMLINSQIRFAHRFTFTRFAMGVLFMMWRDEPCDEKPLLEWQQALAELPKEPREILQGIHTEMLVLLVWHLVTGSPIMLGGLVIWAALNGMAREALKAFAEWLPGLDILQSQAVEAEAIERQSEDLFATSARQ